MRTALALAALLVTTASTLAACSKKEEPAKAEPATTALAPSKAEPGAKATAYTIDGKGTASIDMPAPKEHIKAETTASSGSLEIDVTNLAASRGEVKMDLTTLTTKTFDDAGENAKQTEHARTWLEAVVAGKINEANRFAVYGIRSIDGLSATDLSKVAAVKDGNDDVRAVKMTLHGELLIHGHKVDKEAKVEVKFRYPSGAAADSKPVTLTVATVEPMHIVLKDHDVKPRDNAGAIAQKAFNLLGTKVAETADVTLAMKAARADAPQGAQVPQGAQRPTPSPY